MERTRLALGAALVVITFGCSPQAATPQPSATASASAPALTPASPTPRPPCVAFQAQAAPAAGLRSNLTVLAWATGMTQPDDILVDSDGAIYVGEHGPGRIVQLGGRQAPDGGLHRLPVNVPLVEGIVRIGDLFYAVDQSHDRIVSFRAEDSTATTFFQLQPVPGLDGVDNIAANGDTLIVPDSPRGRVLFIGTDGAVRRSVGGFGRPAGAWPMPDGAVLVADENAANVVRLAPDESRQVLVSGLPLADDVVADQQGAIFAISIGRHNLVQVEGGAAQELVGGLAQPQGLGVDGAGNILVTEFDAGRLDLVLRTFKLLPAATVAALAPGQGLCLQLQRAPGFGEAIGIVPNADYAVVREPGAGDAGEVVPPNCGSPPCLVSIQVRAGARTDIVVAAYRTAA